MEYTDMDEDQRETFIESIERDDKGVTIEGWIEALNIFANNLEEGMKESYFCGGEHDVVYVYVEIEQLQPSSVDGQRLIALGWHPDVDSGNWMKFT